MLDPALQTQEYLVHAVMRPVSLFYKPGRLPAATLDHIVLCALEGTRVASEPDQLALE